MTAIGGCTVLPVVKRQNPGHTGKSHATDSLTSTRGAPNPQKKIRKELRYQLKCINRNLRHIEEYENEHGHEGLLEVEKERINTIRTFYKQQKFMPDEKKHSVANRIVSLAQPWIRPIIWGKTKAPTEFGAKVSISVVDGYTFIDKISFYAYNEGAEGEFVRVVEEYRCRFGCYPSRILADKICRSRPNRGFCSQHGIRIFGPKLGRSGKNHAENLR